MARLDAERQNLRATLAWSTIDDATGGEFGLRMLDVLGPVWWKQQQRTEARRWIDEILRLARGAQQAARVRVPNWGAEFATQQGDLQRSNELAEGALHASRASRARGVLGIVPGGAWAPGPG